MSESAKIKDLEKRPAAAAEPDGFGSTHWSLVLAAARNEDGGVALDRLCRRYWKPVYVFVRRDGIDPSEAEDATQDFFAYILERSWIKEASQERGSFRGFIRVLLKNFLANRRRQASAQKRGGPQRAQLSVAGDRENLEAMVAADPDPAAAYDRAWAMTVSQAALNLLAEEQERGGHAARFRALRGFLTHPPSSADYDRLVRELDEPRNRIAVSLHRLSRRYAELIRAEVIETLADRADIETELRNLIRVLAH